MSKIDEIVERRAEGYGHPKKNFEDIAALWSAWMYSRRESKTFPFTDALEPLDVAAMMILLKLARLIKTIDQDTIDDIQGYAKCIELIYLQKEEEENDG